MVIRDDNFIEFTIKENVQIDDEFVLETKKKLIKYRSGDRLFILAESEGFFGVTNSARKLLSGETCSTLISAAAFHTHHLSLRLLLDLYFKIDKPKFSLKIFADSSGAEKWLKEQMRNTQA
jgi:hypothetical protein